jgi:4-azaleucine resistance transporter AzlC
MNPTNDNIRIGVRDGVAIGLGYLAISFAFGIMATGAGLTVLEAVLISAFNLTSAGQLAALPIIAGGGSVIELALTQLVINLRYSLMSISLSQSFDKKIKPYHRLWLAFSLTDEIYAVSLGRGETLGKKYMLGILIMPYIGWTLGTLLGATAGNILPSLIVVALGISMYAMFIAIVVPAARDSLPVALCVITSVILSCIFRYAPVLSEIPSGFVIIICAILCATAFALIFPINDKECEEVVAHE